MTEATDFCPRFVFTVLTHRTLRLFLGLLREPILAQGLCLVDQLKIISASVKDNPCQWWLWLYPSIRRMDCLYFLSSTLVCRSWTNLPLTFGLLLLDLIANTVKWVSFHFLNKVCVSPINSNMIRFDKNDNHLYCFQASAPCFWTNSEVSVCCFKNSLSSGITHFEESFPMDLPIRWGWSTDDYGEVFIIARSELKTPLELRKFVLDF